MLEEPRYNEEEVTRVLARAAELAALGSHAGDPRAMTLAEVEKIAVEAGLSSALVRQAARELERRTPAPEPPRGNFFLGAATSISIEREVLGEFPAAEFDRLLDIIRQHAGEPGEVHVLGSTLSWSSSTAPGQVQPSLAVSVSARDGSTTIRLQRHGGQMAGGLFGGAVAGVGAGIGLPIAIAVGHAAVPGLGVAAGFTFISSVWLACRATFRKSMGRAHDKAHAIADDLESTCRRRLSQASLG